VSRLKPAPIAEETRYLNRELSWLQFNDRVLAEAEHKSNPLLERLKFLAIFDSNLDEFYMVRVSGLIEQFESGVLETSPDGLTPNEQLRAISTSATPLRRKAGEVFEKHLHPALKDAGIAIRSYQEISEKHRLWLEDYFCREVFPLCTPLMLHPASSIPFISNRSLNLAVELADSPENRLARVKVPTVIPRLIKLPGRKLEYVLLEDVIAHNLGMLFPGVNILGAHVFRVLRDADIEIRELEAADLITNIEETIRLRRFGDPVLMQCASSMPHNVRSWLERMLDLDSEDVMDLPGLLGLEVLWELVGLDKPALRYPPHIPHSLDTLTKGETLFEAIRTQDILVHHPYDSFRAVEEFTATAATDSSVIGIKQTLYRVGALSPIVDSLLAAAERGRQVAAVVELKARFDESNNLLWAKTLEQEGVHVNYGFPDLKVHCKLCLVVRKETDGLKIYAHIGTGNYNPVTARQYTDLGFFTDDPDVTQDVSELFNYLTGFSKQAKYRSLLVSPLNLREGLLARIKKETDFALKGKKARIIFKVNSLVDPEVIDALYAASQAGVKVDLIVRGVCCLRPRVKGISDHIHVISIIGRFLEHSRVYYFENGGTADVLIGSADIMRRNLDRRIEVLVPVRSKKHKKYLRDDLLEICLEDTFGAWELQSDGNYLKRKPQGNKKPFSSQAYFMAHPSTKELLELRVGKGKQ
jgi:polyphosphate kinase